MGVGLCERFLLKARWSTRRPAAIALSGTSHSVSENRSLAGLVQISFWSLPNLRSSPRVEPSVSFVALLASGASGGAAFDDERSVDFVAACGSAECTSCACTEEGTQAKQKLNNTIARRIPPRSRIVMCASGIATPALNSADNGPQPTGRVLRKCNARHVTRTSARSGWRFRRHRRLVLPQECSSIAYSR